MFRINEYDLWTTTEKGMKRYWARVRATGDVTEISKDVMRFLRHEEKKMYRESLSEREDTDNLSLDTESDSWRESWEDDGGRGVEDMEFRIKEEEFRRILTDEQLAVYRCCIIEGETATGYARRHNKSQQAVSDTVAQIRKRASVFFLG